MDTTTVIMVQIADREWTMDALYRACRLGRTMPTHIALVKMIPVQHMGWMGTELGNQNYSEQDLREIVNYEATIEDYGIEFSSTVFQYSDLDEAILQAADMLNASIVFATLPKSVIPFWRNWQLQNLRRRLWRDQRVLVEHLTHVTTNSLPVGDIIKSKV
jgi:uncharacterized protein YjbI with pentapeptide repeats